MTDIFQLSEVQKNVMGDCTNIANVHVTFEPGPTEGHGPVVEKIVQVPDVGDGHVSFDIYGNSVAFAYNGRFFVSGYYGKINRESMNTTVSYFREKGKKNTIEEKVRRAYERELVNSIIINSSLAVSVDALYAYFDYNAHYGCGSLMVHRGVSNTERVGEWNVSLSDAAVLRDAVYASNSSVNKDMVSPIDLDDVEVRKAIEGMKLATNVDLHVPSVEEINATMTLKAALDKVQRNTMWGTHYSRQVQELRDAMYELDAAMSQQ